jgi:hypothetical protein
LISIYHSSSPGELATQLFEFNSYTHEVVLIGGYRNAGFGFSADVVFAERWFRTGIGKHIEVYSSRGNKIWEGLVNEISFAIGPRSIKIGPLLGISNRINIGYQTPTYSSVPGAGGGTYLETGWKDNKESQMSYGVLEELISGGDGEDAAMDDLQDARLEKQGTPNLSETLATGASSEAIVISVSCIGYSRILEKQVYQRFWAAGTGMDSYVDLSVKINTMLNANLYFVGNRNLARDIQNIGLDVAPEDEDNRTAWGIIEDSISKSPTPDAIRCGIGADLSFRLEKLGTGLVYKRKPGSGIIQDLRGSAVLNSEVAPGGYMSMVDFSSAMQYRITSVQYDISSDAVSINFQDSSLRTMMSGMMLGGFS